MTQVSLRASWRLFRETFSAIVGAGAGSTCVVAAGEGGGSESHGHRFGSRRLGALERGQARQRLPEPGGALPREGPALQAGRPFVPGPGGALPREGPALQAGRPFVVEGVGRLALLSERRDWASEIGPFAGRGLDEAERRAVAAHWAQAGLMEHASVAAFARFALQLLALGAPADLVVEAQVAMGDEIEHARLCFGLAEALGARPIGPGPLPIGGALEGCDLASALAMAVVEGCVGETLAAFEAAEAREFAEDPEVRRVLERVRDDETRHAQLAWRFVRWALLRGGEDARQAASSAFRSVLDEADGVAVKTCSWSKAERRQARWGVLPGAYRAALRQLVLHDLVAPCSGHLLPGPNAVGEQAASPLGGVSFLERNAGFRQGARLRPAWAARPDRAASCGAGAALFRKIRATQN
ncbi:MAG: ferritin-like domain-containing protein [Polyangiaceae bacterium]|nr:ferritin-like domain-containing protein [Polyangiaceae bacterium]